MHVLILTPHFYPENFKCNDIAFELKKRGYEVSVMTAIPDYPQGSFFKGYGIFKKRMEIIEGVKIHRSLIIPRGNGSALRLALNYLSYTFFASIKAFWFGLRKKYDTIVVHEPSPVLVGVPAVIIKKLQKIPIHFWVLDLWPESLSAAGGIKNEQILSLFENITKWIYCNCKTILIGSKGYKESIVKKKAEFKYKIKYFPNWVEACLITPSKKEVPKLPQGFNILIAGNMGEAQDLPHILNAFLMLKGKAINLNLVGDGRKIEYVKRFIIEHQLQNQVFCYGRYPLAVMPSFFEQADLLFMALKDEPIFSLTVPSRIQAYMSAGKPIVAMINGEGAQLIKEADCGWSVPAEDYKSLAKLLTDLANTDKNILIQKGANGRKFCEMHFDFNKCIDNLESYITAQKDSH